jgi:hypothetical protein
MDIYIYEGRLFVCLSQTMASLVMLLVPLESPPMSRVALSWFQNVLTCNGKVIEYFEYFFTENSFKSKHKLYRII